MSLESGTYISDLVATNPQGTDPKSQGDDHLRLIKSVLKNTFPGSDGPMHQRNPSGNVLTIGAAENALEINQTDKTIKGVNGYSIDGTPSGAIMDFAMNAAPAGWLACNGAAVSRTTYAALFAAIGVVWGAGDGSTTFNLPDMRGYFRRGYGTNNDGVASGAFAAKQADDLRSHAHVVPITTNTGGGGGTAGGNGTPGSPNSSTSAFGGTETRPFNIAVLTCIKA